MKILLVFILLAVASCANLSDKPQASEVYTSDCSTAAMEKLQSDLDTATAELNAAGKVSDNYPTEENNAKTGDAAMAVATSYAMLDIARSDCLAK